MSRHCSEQAVRFRRAGFSLLEVAVVLAVGALVLTPAVALLFQFMAIPAERIDMTTLVRATRQAVLWIGVDARQAESFAPGSNPDYGTFTWTDRTSGSTPVSHTVRYFHDPTEERLVREETIDAGSPESFPIASHIQSYGDISIAETSGVLTASVTAKNESIRGLIQKTATVKVQMRPLLPSAVPTPPPITLAWDDFETGDFTGGDGWLGDWFDSGDAKVRSGGGPYEGSYHLRLRKDSGYVDRSLDLTGRTKVRLQFWAKAKSFETGEFADLQVSPDGAVFTTVRTWVDGEDDDVYRFEDIDLSSFAMSAEFFIAFDAEMSDKNDEFYVDDLRIVSGW